MSTPRPKWDGFRECDVRRFAVGGSATLPNINVASDGPRYHYPSGVGIAPNGDCIVANTFGHSICRQRDNVILATVAGGKRSGFRDGKSWESLFKFPEGIAVDNAGIIYVADCDNHAVRSIAPTGQVSTLAGSGNPGHRDGRGSSAAFDFPRDIALDSDSLVVADSACLRRVSLDGEVWTIPTGRLRTPAGAETNLGFLGGIAIDSNADILVTNTSLHALLVIDRRGDVFVLAGGNGSGFSDGKGWKASFDKPRGICVDQTGQVYIADSNNNAIRVLLNNGSVETLLGEDFGIEGGFSHPAGIAIARDGCLYVSDQFNDRVCKLRL